MNNDPDSKNSFVGCLNISLIGMVPFIEVSNGKFTTAKYRNAKYPIKTHHPVGIHKQPGRGGKKGKIFTNRMTVAGNEILRFLILFALVLFFSECDHQVKSAGPRYGDAPATEIPVYHFAVHPLHNPFKLMQEYQPLIDYINAHLRGARLVLEASRDYATFEQKYKNRKPEFLLPNPWQTLQAMELGYTVVAMAGDPADFKGIFIVRKDGGIKEPADLKGKAVSYPSATALAACIMPQYFLYTHGIDINKDIRNQYVGSQESSIMNVYFKKTVAGATWPPPWRDFKKMHPNEALKLKMIWETKPLINNSVMVRSDIPSDIQGQVKKCLFELCYTEQGKIILSQMETDCFTPAGNRDYEVVRDYVTHFEEKVRMVE